MNVRQLCTLTATALVLCAAQPLAAQTVDMEAFRTELLELSAALYDVTATSTGTAYAENRAFLDERIMAASEAELQALFDAMPPGQQPLGEIVDTIETAVAEAAAQRVGHSEGTWTEADPPYSGRCGPWRPPTEVVFTITLVKDGTAVAGTIADFACKQITGETRQIPKSIACAVGLTAKLLQIAATIALDILKFCALDIDSAEIKAGFEQGLSVEGLLLHDQVGLASRASQQSLDALQSTVDVVSGGVGIVQGGVVDLQTGVAGLQAAAGDLDADLGQLAGQTTALGTALGEHADLQLAFNELNLRVLIESNLQGNLPGRICLFQLPEAVGGYLELVREIVIDAIDMTLAAGEDVHEALEYVQKADHLYATQRYKRAYGGYRAAYLEAVRP